MFRIGVRLFAALSIVLMSFTGLELSALAQTEATFTIDSISRACDANRVDITWTPDDVEDVWQMTISLSNSSDDWSDQVWVEDDLDASATSVTFDHHQIDKVFIRVRLADGSEWQFQGDVGTCGAAEVTGGWWDLSRFPSWMCLPNFDTNPSTLTLTRVTSDITYTWDGFPATSTTDCSTLLVTHVTFNCVDMTATISWETKVSGYIGAHTYLDDEGVEYVLPTRGFGANGSETVSLNEDFDRLVVSATHYHPNDGGNPQQFYSASYPLNCEEDVVTPDVEANPVSIIVRTADGTSLTGAPFGIYAPAASTLPADALFTGTVGANNTISIPDALPGAYVVRVAPAAGDLVEFGVQINASTTLLVVGLDGEETLEFVESDYFDESVFYPTVSIWHDDTCGLVMWIVADEGGGKGTLTFTNASGWTQVVEKDIPAKDYPSSLRSQEWCFDLTDSPDTITFDVVMNRGGRFFYKVTLHGDGDPTIIGGRLVSTTPTPTETPTAPPTATETPTSQNVTVQVIMADGSSLAGAPFGMYAPAASTLPAGAIHTGTVEANNILTLLDLLPGDYVIRIAPVDGELIEFTIEIGEDTDKLVVNLGQTDPDATETPTATETPAATETATATAEATKDATVDSLPQTGAGGSPSSLLLIVTAATVMVGGFAFVVRTGEVRRRA